MKKYTDGKGGVWAFESDGSQDSFIPPGLTLITEDQAFAILNPPLTLSQVQTLQVSSISSACNATITSGVSSLALGSAHIYPTKSDDQRDLSASVLASVIPGNPANWTTQLWCIDLVGNWSFAYHSASQAQQVGEDVKNQITAMRVKNAILINKVKSSNVISDIQSIIWAFP